MADPIGHLTPQEVREAIIRIRRQKLPDPEELGSAGSFFKNPVVSREDFARISPDGSAPHYDLPDGTVKVPAAWMIDRCGFKGAVEGGAAVYEKQPLVIVNASGEASPAEVLALENRIINGVRERFGVTLHPEVEHI
jgi:UDP-N-acetylmuramate dehydrogenase